MRFSISAWLMISLFNAQAFACGQHPSNERKHQSQNHHEDVGHDHSEHQMSDDGIVNRDDKHSVAINSSDMSLSGTITVTVAGMMCASCRGKLESAVRKIPEVSNVTADLKTKTMRISLAAPIAREALESAVRHAGFKTI